MKPLEDYKF